MSSDLATTRPSSYLLHSTFWGRTAWISDLNKATSFYQIEIRNRRPHYTFTDSSGAVIAHSSTNSGKSIEFDVHGQSFTIPLFSYVIATEFRYQSPALGGQEVIWKSASVAASGEIVCTDAKRNKLGRFQQLSLGRNVGSLDFEGAADMPLRLLDELVVVGMVLAWHRLFQSSLLISAAAAIF